MKISTLLPATLLILAAVAASAQAPGSAKSTPAKHVIANKKSNGKYILVDSLSRNPVSEAEYDEAGRTKNGMIYLFKKGHWGIATKNGDVLINPDTSKYRYIDDEIDSAGNFIAYMYDSKKKDFLGDMILLNRRYVQITPRSYNFIMAYKQGYYQPYQRNSGDYGDLLFGLLSKEGKELLEPTYKLITINTKEGLIFTWASDRKYGLYDLTGKTILPDEYDRIERENLSSRKYIEVSKEGLSGLIDKKGKVIVPVKYSLLSYNDFGANSYYDVEIDDKKGVLSLSGKVIITPEYNELFPQMDEGCLYFSASKDGQNWGWIDVTGKTILPLIYKDVVGCPGKEGQSLAKISDSAYVFVNKTAQIMLNKRFKDASTFYNGITYVKEKDKYGMINNKGQYVVQPSYENIIHIYNNNDYNHEMYAVKKDGKWGFLNNAGKAITPVTYDDPGEESDGFIFSEELVAVSINNKWGYINRTGKTVIPFSYDGASPFSDGKAQVISGTEKFFIDKNGSKKN